MLFHYSTECIGDWSATCPRRFVPGKDGRHQFHRRLGSTKRRSRCLRKKVQFLVPVGNQALGRPRCRWNVVLKCIFKNWKGGGALVHAVIKLRVPYNTENFLGD